SFSRGLIDWYGSSPRTVGSRTTTGNDWAWSIALVARGASCERSVRTKERVSSACSQQVSLGNCLAVENSKNVPFRGGNPGSATEVNMHLGEAGRPVSRQTSTRFTSIGRPNSRGGCFCSEAFIISVHTGNAIWLEKAPRMIV